MSEITPTVADVGAMLRARTKDQYKELGTFTEDTRPTGTQVTLLIAEAEGEVSSRIGSIEPCSAVLVASSKRMVALYAALLVEMSFFPEQIKDNSPYDRLKDLYDDGITALSTAVEEQCGTDTVGSASGDGLVQGPVFDFSTALPPIPKDGIL